MNLPLKSYLCFGDSITQNGGWIDLLNKTKQGRFLNGGQSGRQAQNGPKEFPPLLAAHPEANHLLLFLGINDLPSRDPRPGPARIAAAVEGLRQCIEHALPVIRPENIILLTPCGLDPDAMSEINLGKGYHEALPLLKPYAEALKKLALEKNLRFLNLLSLFSDIHFRDGIHLNDQGERQLAKILTNYLDRPSLYWVGDSISLGYHKTLKTALAKDFHYFRKTGMAEANRNLDQAQGANGGDSAMVLAHLQELVETNNLWADTIVVNCGLHDIKANPHTGNRQISKENYRKNLESMIHLLNRANKNLIWLTTTPMDETIHQRYQKHFHRKEADLTAYQEIARNLMDAHRIPIFDLYAFTTSLGPDLFRDHVHFHPQIAHQQGLFLSQKVKEHFPK
ncbi:MAG: SGNH/GDSL hydrolase family protein [Opitutales bacterium]|nr:SGNH/GDSL hydrolase family protein [Opitutales bacterium]